MVRGKRLAAGPSTLSLLVSHLKAPPKLALPTASSLRLTLATRNDHFGARHFLKEQLPRIRYANPELDIQIRKVPKKPGHEWRPELQLSFPDGKSRTLNLHGKWSTAIVRELMDSSGSPAWARWKAEAARAGLPLVPGEEHAENVEEETAVPRYSLDQWQANHPPRKVRRRGEPSRKRGTAKTSKAEPTKRKKDANEVAAAAPVETAVDPEKAKADAEREKEEDGKRRAAKKEARRAKLDAPRLAEEEAERRVALELLAKPRTGAAAVLP
ncbi:hypothetical protein C8R43DRAFT_974119 [Mycena crocata]|nr:hypothetical protein C8R43DRAFT_974119 [Mycena crocata]